MSNTWTVLTFHSQILKKTSGQRCCFSYLMKQAQVWKDFQTQRDCYSRYLNILWFFKIFELHSQKFYSKDLNLIDSSVNLCLQGINFHEMANNHLLQNCYTIFYVKCLLRNVVWVNLGLLEITAVVIPILKTLLSII